MNPPTYTFWIFTEDWVLFPCIFSPTKFGGVEGSGVSKKYHENFKISDKNFNLTQPTQDPHLHHRLDGDWQEHPLHRNHQSVHVVHQGEVLHFNNAENCIAEQKPGSWNRLSPCFSFQKLRKRKFLAEDQLTVLWIHVIFPGHYCAHDDCGCAIWNCRKSQKKWTINMSVCGW